MKIQSFIGIIFADKKMINIKGREESMNRFSKDEVKALITNIMALLNEEVFGTIYDFLQINPEKRSMLNCAFPFPKNVRIGLLKEYLVIEYCGPEEVESDILSVQCEEQPQYGIEKFLGLDISHEFVNKFSIEEAVENMTFFLGNSIAHLTDYFYDLTQIPSEMICMNATIDFDSIKTYSYISNTTFFWTNIDNELKIRKIDFMEIIPFTEEGVVYHDSSTISGLAELIIRLQVPQYNVQLHKYLNELIELINLNETSEVDITNYLTEHPEILQYAFGINRLNAQTLLKWQYQTENRDLKPDFMPEKMDGYCDIMEFKMPHLDGKCIVGTNERKQPSYQIDSAIAQINKYDEWCSQKINTDWLEKEYNMKVFKPNKYIVIGHSSDFTPEDRRRLREERNVIIYTYDEFIEMARYQIYRYR